MGFAKDYTPKGRFIQKILVTYQDNKHEITLGRKYMYVKNAVTKEIKQVKLTLSLTQLFIQAVNEIDKERAFELIRIVNEIDLQNKIKNAEDNFKAYTLQNKK